MIIVTYIYLKFLYIPMLKVFLLISHGFALIIYFFLLSSSLLYLYYLLSPLFSSFLMASWLGFGSPSAEIDITLRDASSRSLVSGRNENNEVEQQYLFTANDTISGQVSISLKSKKLDHLGIKIELIGHIEFQYDKSNPYEFTSLVRDLDPPGTLDESKKYQFEFTNVDKTFETYNGNNVRLRYFLRVKILRQYASNITKTIDLMVQNTGSERIL